MGKRVEAVTDFLFLGSKVATVTAAIKLKDTCFLEGKLWKPRQEIKSKDITFAHKGLYSQSYSFSGSHVWMWELDHKEGWVPKNWCFQIMMLEKTLEVPWIAKRSNQSILKHINSEYSLEGLMLKLNLQYFGHLMWRADSLEKTLMLEKIGGKRRRGQWRMRWLDSITNSMDRNLNKLRKIVEGKGAWHATVHGVTKNWTQFSN